MVLDPTKHPDWQIAYEADTKMKSLDALAEGLGLLGLARRGLLVSGAIRQPSGGLSMNIKCRVSGHRIGPCISTCGRGCGDGPGQGPVLGQPAHSSRARRRWSWLRPY